MILMLRRVQHGLRLAAAIVVALLAQSVLASSLRAGCGNDVVVVVQGNATTPSSHHAERNHVDAHSIPPASLPMDAPKPCSGPHCRRSPALPIPTPAVPLPELRQEWSCRLAPFVFTPTDGFTSLVEEIVPSPIFSANEIFHPPR
jgi:hypothetical protein